MPAPILAGLARIGAMLASRAGAAGTARSLVAASRSGRLAALAGEKGALAGRAAQTGGGFRVLENTQLVNSRDLLKAIYGRTPGAGAAAGVPSQAAAAASTSDPLLTATQQILAQSPQTSAAELQQALGVGADRAGKLLTAAGKAAPPPVNPPVAAGPGSTPPSNPTPPPATSMPPRAPKPNAQTAGQTLASAGGVPPTGGGGGKGGGSGGSGGSSSPPLPPPNLPPRMPQPHHLPPRKPSWMEQAGQWAHTQIQQEMEAEFKSAMKRLLMRTARAVTFAANPVTAGMAAATMPAWMYGLVQGFQQFGRLISESNRDLSQFNERIADSFARLDYSQLRSRQQVAQATSGSAAYLNDQLALLVKDLQPAREAVVTLLNTGGIIITHLARMATALQKIHPLSVAVMKGVVILEKLFGSRPSEEAQATSKEFLRSIRDGKFTMPKNPKP